MDDIEDHIHEPGGDANPQAAPDGTIWAHLRSQHEQASTRDPLYLDDPVHDGVVYRYRYVTLGETKGATRRLEKMRDRTDQTIASAIETLLLALDEIMVQAPDGEIPHGVDGRELYPQPVKSLADPGEPPIRFDEVLCEGMGFPAGTEQHARKIVRAMFAGNDYLIIEHAQEVSRWLAETGSDVREEFAEELTKG